MNNEVNFAEYIIQKAIEPISTGITMPRVNRFNMVCCCWTCENLNDFVIRREYMNDMPMYILEEVAEFDFWNEFEGFVSNSHVTTKNLKPGSYNCVAVGDRILETNTMKLYKVYGFNKASGGAEIYYNVA